MVRWKAARMLVDPDFLDHWKVRMLIDALQDDRAPLYVLRIWSHCQQRKSVEFRGMTANGLKALCRYDGDPAKLEAALIPNFIERDGDTILVPKWAEHNAWLIARWDNGKRGGRKPKANQEETRSEPGENQAGTRREPGENRIPSSDIPTPLDPLSSCPVGSSPEGGVGETTSGPSFLAFWHAYPPHKRKRQGDAQAEWAGLREEGIDPAAILAGVTAYAASPVGKGQYALEPANWLRGRCWLDDPASWRDNGKPKGKGIDPTPGNVVQAADLTNPKAISLAEYKRRAGG